jgi:hypothetical protein
MRFVFFCVLLLFAACLVTTPAYAQDETARDPDALAEHQVNEAVTPPPQSARSAALFVPTMAMYAAYGTLQALDVHSTLRAIDRNGVEGNPLLRPVATSPAGLTAFKAASTAGIIYLTERLRKKHPVAALAFGIGVNSLQAFVVLHNYRVAKL